MAYALHSITHSRTFRDVTCSTIRVFDRHRSSTVPSRRQGRRTAAMLTEGKTASANVSQTVWEASPRGQQFCHVGRAASRGSTRDPLRILFGPVLDRMLCIKPACTTEDFDLLLYWKSKLGPGGRSLYTVGEQGVMHALTNSDSNFHTM